MQDKMFEARNDAQRFVDSLTHVVMLNADQEPITPVMDIHRDGRSLPLPDAHSALAVVYVGWCARADGPILITTGPFRVMPGAQISIPGGPQARIVSFD